MIDYREFATRLSREDLESILGNLQSLQDVMHKAIPRGRRQEREAGRERCYMTAVLLGSLVYEIARHMGESESHARVLACCRTDGWAPELSRGLLFVHPDRDRPA